MLEAYGNGRLDTGTHERATGSRVSPGTLRVERRRHPRARGWWRVMVDIGGDPFHAMASDVSPFGAKVAIAERLSPGTRARLRLHRDESETVAVEALVWRSDPNGVVFFFWDACPASPFAA